MSGRPVQRPRPNARGAHTPQSTNSNPVQGTLATEPPKLITRHHLGSFPHLTTCSEILGIESAVSTTPSSVAFVALTAGAHTTGLQKNQPFDHLEYHGGNHNTFVSGNTELRKSGASSCTYTNSLIEHILLPNGGYITFFKPPTSQTPIEDIVTSCLLYNAPKRFSQFLVNTNINKIDQDSTSQERSNHILRTIDRRRIASDNNNVVNVWDSSTFRTRRGNIYNHFYEGPKSRKNVILLDPDKLCVDGTDSYLCMLERKGEFSCSGKSESSPKTDAGQCTYDEVRESSSHIFSESSTQRIAPYKYGDRPHLNSTSSRFEQLNSAFFGENSEVFSDGSGVLVGGMSSFNTGPFYRRESQQQFDCRLTTQESVSRTSQALLIVNLRIGFDSPEVPRIEPCAKLECWIDPKVAQAKYHDRASDSICDALEKQYATVIKLQQYRRCVEETLENAKAALRSTRKKAKGDRVLIHYNGHGMPKAGVYGEIWFTGKSHYFPIPITDLSNEAGSPAIYVFDCHSAGSILNVWRSRNMHSIPEKSNDILLCACDANEFLPMNPALPADLLTSCLLTPLKMALEWFIHFSYRGFLLPEVTPEMIREKIPGDISNRKTPLGELNLVLTTILDCIAWDTLGREMYYSIMRKDMTVKVLFRNFFLADKLIREVGCTPVSYPAIPESAHTHRLWDSWDVTIDRVAAQLPKLLRNEGKLKSEQAEDLSSPSSIFELSQSSFFSEQLAALDVAIEVGNLESRAPEQLPTLLLCLTQTAYRVRALLLLSRYLETGPAAVHNVLFCGISNLITRLLDNGETLLMMIVVWMQIVRVHPEFALPELAKVHGDGTFLKYLQTKESKFRIIGGDELADAVPDHNTNERFQGTKALGIQGDISLPAYCAIEGITMDRCRAIACYLLCRMLEWSTRQKYIEMERNFIVHHQELIKQRSKSASCSSSRTYNQSNQNITNIRTSPQYQSQDHYCVSSCQNYRNESVDRVRDTPVGIGFGDGMLDSGTPSGTVEISIWNRRGLTIGAELLDSSDPEVRSWGCLFLAKLMGSLNVAKEYTSNEFAKRQNLFFPLLEDNQPAVRASCVTLLGSLMGFRIDLFRFGVSVGSSTKASPTTGTFVYPDTVVNNAEDQDRRLEVDRTILQLLTVHVNDPSRAVRIEIAVAAANLVYHYYPLVKTARAHGRLPNEKGPFGTGTFAVPTYVQRAPDATNHLHRVPSSRKFQSPGCHNAKDINTKSPVRSPLLPTQSSTQPSSSLVSSFSSSDQSPPKTLQMMYTTCVGVLAELNYFSDRVYQIEKRNIGVTSTLAKADFGMENKRASRSLDHQRGKEGSVTGVLTSNEEEDEEESLYYTNPNHVFQTGCITGEDTPCFGGPWVLSNVTEYHLATIEAMVHDALLILYNMRASCDVGVAQEAERCLETLNGGPEESINEVGSHMNVACYTPPQSHRVETEGNLSMSSILFKCGNGGVIHSQVNSEADRARECRNNDLMHQIVLDLPLGRVFHSYADANAAAPSGLESRTNYINGGDQRIPISQQRENFHSLTESSYNRNEHTSTGQEPTSPTNISPEARQRPFMSIQHALPIYNHDSIHSVQFRLLEPHFVTIERNNRISTVSYKENQNVVLESFVHPGCVEVQQGLLINDLTDYFGLLVADSRGIFSLYNGLLSGNPTIVSSFNGVNVSDIGLLSPGELQCAYRQQDAILFYGSGRNDSIQMVSIDQEQVVQSLGISGNAAITSISTQKNGGRAVFAGFRDGIVRYFDDRNKEGRTSLVLSMETAHRSRTCDDEVVSCGDFGNNSIAVATRTELKIFDLRNYRIPKRTISVLPTITLPSNLSYNSHMKGNTGRVETSDVKTLPSSETSSLNKRHVISSFSCGGYYPIAGMISSEGICDIFNGKGESLLLCGARVSENHYYNGTPHSLGLCAPRKHQGGGIGSAVGYLPSTMTGGVIKGNQHSIINTDNEEGREGKGGHQFVPYDPQHHQHLAVQPEYMSDVGRIVAGSDHVSSGVDSVSLSSHNIIRERSGVADDHTQSSLIAARIRAEAPPGSVFGARLIVNTNSRPRPIRLKYNACSRIVVMHPMKPMGFFGGEIITMM